MFYDSHWKHGYGLQQAGQGMLLQLRSASLVALQSLVSKAETVAKKIADDRSKSSPWLQHPAGDCWKHSGRHESDLGRDTSVVVLDG